MATRRTKVESNRLKCHFRCHGTSDGTSVILLNILIFVSEISPNAVNQVPGATLLHTRRVQGVAHPDDPGS